MMWYGLVFFDYIRNLLKMEEKKLLIFNLVFYDC